MRRQLLFRLLSGLAIAGFAAAGAVYVKAQDEANELFDYQLQQMLLALPVATLAASASPPAEAADHEAGEDEDEDDEFVIRVVDRNGTQLYLSASATGLPLQTPPGYSTVENQLGYWRVYSAVRLGNTVQIAQPMHVRQEWAATMASRTLAPLAFLLPFLGVLIWLTVGRGLRPLNRVAEAVSRRDAAALQPLAEDSLPAEVRPLVDALNELLSRLSRALSTQKAFIADAAHELRSPLTAVKLQIQLAERATDEAQRRVAFTELKQGLDRASRLVQQLLALARQEPGVDAAAFKELDLLQLTRAVVAEQAPLAAHKGIDLGITRAEPASMAGDVEALRVMLENVLDNALRYTPERGRIDVSLAATADHAIVEVSDTGPGIPEAERTRVFDRFYRREGSGVSGSGLGLAIVKNIAERHDAEIRLASSADGHGLRVVIRLPRRVGPK